jgi:glucose/arabinose dehydrogenase
MTSPLRRLTRATGVVLLAFSALHAPVSSADAASRPTSIGAGLRGPSGLDATVIATGLKHVSALASDADGRVWAATAAASDTGKDAVYLLSDSSTTPTKVVTDVHTPLGLVWIGDTLYVSEANAVLALGGFDGTTFASRTTVVTFPEGTGELNGITAGPDGRLYVGISAPCDACTPTAESSASIVSFRPDGTDVQTYASDIRAPIGLAFFPGTNDLFVTMNQRDDLGTKTPGDWLALVRAGESWGFPACYGQDSARCGDVPQPIAALDRHAAVSGVAIVTGQLGSSIGTGAAVAEWVTGKVRWVRLTATGDGYSGTATSFLSGFENPVPVLLDHHGTLLVGDWTSGKVYRISA